MPPSGDHRPPSKQNASVCAIASTFFAAVFLALVLILNLGYQDEPSAMIRAPTTSPTASPTALSLGGYVKGLLPDFSLEALLDQTSPQRQAWDWLMEDPSLPYFANQVEDNRIITRIALATLYFESNAPQWEENTVRGDLAWRQYVQDDSLPC